MCAWKGGEGKLVHIKVYIQGYKSLQSCESMHSNKMGVTLRLLKH